MNPDDIHWKLPWRPLRYAGEVPGLQQRLEKEITPPHPLWGQGAQVIGRRIDCDDVVVSLTGGRYACVHLVWGARPEPFPARYPHAFIYPSFAEFQADMEEDARAYGEDDEEET